jgi:mono/diheme cytochrome c family protein
MKYLVTWMAILVAIMALVVVSTAPVRALPEYAAQTGEPCAACHVSASGGGQRTPRGQAWVAAGKSGLVPALAESLQLLGVKTRVDQSAYLVTPGQAIPPANAPEGKHSQARAIHDWLSDYAGN